MFCKNRAVAVYIAAITGYVSMVVAIIVEVGGGDGRDNCQLMQDVAIQFRI